MQNSGEINSEESNDFFISSKNSHTSLLSFFPHHITSTVTFKIILNSRYRPYTYPFSLGSIYVDKDIYTFNFEQNKYKHTIF